VKRSKSIVVRPTAGGFFALLFSVCLMGVVGCDQKQRPLAPVSGVVTFDGKPLRGGGVTFLPIAPPGTIIAGKSSIARCDGEGRFELITIDDKPGAVVGEHQVQIFGPKVRPAGATDDGGGRNPPELIPRRYNFDTELTFTVPPEGSDQANFDLTSK
jgi:hypothetical protein